MPRALNAIETLELAGPVTERPGGPNISRLYRGRSTLPLGHEFHVGRAELTALALAVELDLVPGDLALVEEGHLVAAKVDVHAEGDGDLGPHLRAPVVFQSILPF